MSEGEKESKRKESVIQKSKPRITANSFRILLSSFVKITRRSKEWYLESTEYKMESDMKERNDEKFTIRPRRKLHRTMRHTCCFAYSSHVSEHLSHCFSSFFNPPLGWVENFSIYPCIYIYIYIYCHPQTDCFVSQPFNVARHVGRLKLGLKPTQLHVRLSIRPLGQQTYHVG